MPPEKLATVPTRRKTLIYVATEDWYFWLHRLALGKGALAAGYEVIVAARVTAHRERLEAEGFRVVALPWQRRGGSIAGELRTLVRLYRLFRRERPAVVHSIALKPIIYAGLVARLARVAGRVATIAGLGYVYTSRRLKARLLYWPVSLALGLAMGGRRSRVLLENPDDGERLARVGVLAREQIALVSSCGVDIGLFFPAPEPDGPVVIGMACRLVRDKGVDVAVAAIRRLKPGFPEIVFRLAGSIDPGNPDSLTAGELEQWQAEGVVQWVGHVDDMPGFWQGCHIVLYPSRYGEGVPRTLLEAAACARPIVTADMPGCREAVADGVNGFLAPADGPVIIAERLERLVASPELRRRMGAAGRARAEAEFADAIVVAKTLAVYRGLA